MDENRFHIHAREKSLKDRKLMENYFNKRAMLASGLKTSETTIFLLQSSNEKCDRFCLIIQEKQAGKDAKRFDIESILKLSKY